ncbi:ATP-dependent helicase HrpB [Aliiglaciecola litoralis]|uniref:ATP-dependent helicase HrpB n=2 Tax=Aliiglaciecola litoralis TaxID=582857 RepID=A0ABP3WNK1_9ALTE
MVEKDVILVAPPGAGKSTYLPLKLLQLACFEQQKIIMLQPRQIAVRAIANYLAEQLGEQVGNTVGYRMRGEVQVSANTRLEIVTEGLLTRMLQSDPELQGIGLIIFDEFHERNAHADFSLALCLEAQQALRPDLRLLLMSATLEVEPVNALMSEAEVVQTQGRSYPVSVHYCPVNPKLKLEPQLFSLIKNALIEHTGDILVFLPGAAEIRRLESLCQTLDGAQFDVMPLYGALNKEQQIAAIKPSSAGHRKIVLATNIAETSLTIDGISVVIDSGKEKVASFNWQRKLPQLSTQHISKASATQRAGRAGRQSAGHCYRLWSQEQQQRRSEQHTAEILLLDVTGFYLEAKVWGNELSELALLDKPKSSQIQYAKDTLSWLGALDKDGKLTAKGRALNQFGTHPRLANLLLEAQQMENAITQLGCLVCALIDHKPIKELSHTVWISDHLQFLLSSLHHPIWQQAKRWAKRLGVSLHSADINKALPHLGNILCAAYPDYIGKRRSAEAYSLVNGTGVSFPPQHQPHNSQWLIAPNLSLQHHADARIRLAAPLDEQQLLTDFADHISHQQEVFWSTELQRVIAREYTKLGAITVSEKTLKSPDSAASAVAIMSEITKQGLAWLNWSDSVNQFIYRVRRARELLGQDWPDFTDATLLNQLYKWLFPFLDGVRSAQQLKQLDWLQILKNRLSWQQQQALETLLPARTEVATGHTVALRYLDNGEVELHTKLQQLYGWQSAPTIANGKLVLTLVLLSPAGRPLQKTKDLNSFWQGSYQEVKKEMKGRYPKHFWPDDPATAKATSKTKKRM